MLILTVPCLQVATLGLSGAALAAPALPALLPPAQGDQHWAGDLLPSRHGQGLSVSRQQQPHNRSQQQRGWQPTAEPQQFSLIADRQSQETPGLVRDNPLHLISSLCVSLLLHISRVAAVELTFELPDSAKECFHEHIEKDTESTLEFQASLSNNEE